MKKKIFSSYDMFWKYYLQVQRNQRTLVTPAINDCFVDDIKYPKLKSEISAALVIYNSDRSVELSRMRKALGTLHRIKGELPFLILRDVGRKIPKQPFSLFLAFVLRILLTDFVFYLESIVKNKSSSEALMLVFRRWLHRNSIAELVLFTENNRFTEMFRHAAIAEGVTITTFLHGSTSDVFGDYYDVLDNLAENSGAEVRFVNIAPGLPQPEACSKKILKINDLEMYFANESAWLKHDGGYTYDLLIVGGDSFGKPYELTKFFKNEMKAISDCHKNGLKVAYAPHPRIAYRLGLSLPGNVDIIPLPSVIHGCKVVVGHYSTSVFVAKLLGMGVLVFDDAWDEMGATLHSLFCSKESSTYSFGRLCELLDGDVFCNSNVIKGVDLEELD